MPQSEAPDTETVADAALYPLLLQWWISANRTTEGARRSPSAPRRARRSLAAAQRATMGMATAAQR